MMKGQGEYGMKGIKEGKNNGGERNVFNVLERKE
jgi:hypothetical protein